MISIHISHQVKSFEEEEESEGGDDAPMGVDDDDGGKKGGNKKPVQLFKGLKNEGTTCYLNSVI